MFPASPPRLSLIALLAAGGLLAPALTPHASGAVLAEYGFNSSSLASTDADAGSTASDMTLGPGVVIRTSNAIQGNPLPAIDVRTNDTGTTVETGASIEFTLGPAVPGEALDLDSLTFDLRFNSSNQSTAPMVAVRADTGSGFSTLNTIDITGRTFFANDVTALGAAFDNLTDPVTFRVVFFDQNTSSSREYNLDNLIVNGTVIPEPASLALAGLGGLCLLGRRRRG